MELEFKDLAEYDRFWTGWVSKAPESYWNEWYGLTENGGAYEIWQLVE
jgi:hypothetical protein